MWSSVGHAVCSRLDVACSPPTAPDICPLLGHRWEPESLASRSSTVCTVATASPCRRDPHLRGNSLPLEPRTEYLLPTAVARWRLLPTGPGWYHIDNESHYQ